MADETPIRRRRRPQTEEQRPQSAPISEDNRERQSGMNRRIVIDTPTGTPEWIARDTAGAASRRTGTAGKTEIKPTEEKKRIVIDTQEQAPEWIASGTAGAASRRTGTKTDEHKQAKKQASVPARKGGRPDEETDSRSKKQATRPAGGKTPERKPAAVKRKKPKKKRKKKTNRKQVLKIGVTALVLTLVAALTAAGVIAVGRLTAIKKTLDQGDGVFYPNIYVNNIPLGGKTLDEAAQVVTAQVVQQVNNWSITLQTPKGESWKITGEDLNMQFDVADQLDQLWSIGHTGTAAERYEQVQRLEQEPEVRYTALRYDMSMINQILTRIKEEVDQPAVNATRINDSEKWPPFSYTDEVAGQTLDISGMQEKISGMVDRLESGVVDLLPTPVQASVTRAQLEAQIVKLATYETPISTSSTEGRTENMRIGTEKFNHLIVEPGKKVSFNQITGKRTAQNGFQKALEIAYGEYVEGYGGGICQVSSTLYNAVVNAGLKVNTRYQHSLPSSYVPKGLDATVSDDRLDFVFTNNTGAPLYFETDFYKRKGIYYCQFTIYGKPGTDGYTYKLESTVRQEIEIPEPVYRKDEKAQYVVYDDETYQSSKGQKGYIVDVYLVTMDGNGLELSRELTYTDTYKAVAPIVYVGVMPRETPVPAEVPQD